MPRFGSTAAVDIDSDDPLSAYAPVLTIALPKIHTSHDTQEDKTAELIGQQGFRWSED